MRALLTALALTLAGCGPEPSAVAPPPAPPPPPTASAAPAPPRAPGVVTVLYTSDEHGWLFGHGDGDKARGGAAEAMTRWIADEGHCLPVRAPAASTPTLPATNASATSNTPARLIATNGPATSSPATSIAPVATSPTTTNPFATSTPAAPVFAIAPAGPTCTDPSTLLLSGGDNFTGPAVSSFFRGLPMAEAMARMGYVASAFGNHEYDFDRDAFEVNRDASGIAYLAANVRVLPGARDPGLRPSLLVERRGLRIGVVGVATESTPRAAMPSRFEGLAFDPPEPALDRAIGDTYAQGADAVVLVAHACEDELTPIVERHPEWRVAFVGLGHCHRRSRAEAAGAAVVMPGWRLDAYARVRIAIDPGRPVRERVTSVDAALVDVRLPAGLAPDAGIAALRDAAKTKLDAALGVTIGHSAAGMDDDSEAMGRWITRALREELRVDVAVNNTSSIRQSLSKGPITKASVHSVLPFENEVYTLKITGAALARLLTQRAFVVAGAKRVEVPGKTTKSGKPAHEVRLDSGALVDPAKTYTVALTDFLYDVGKYFDFKAADPSPTRTGIDWRAPIIAWTARLATTEKSPLEAKLGGSTKPPPRKKKPKK